MAERQTSIQSSGEFVTGFGIPNLDDDEDDDNPYNKKFVPIEDVDEERDNDDGVNGRDGDPDDEWAVRKKKTVEDEEWIDPDADPDEQWKPKSKSKPQSSSDPSARPDFDDEEDEIDLHEQFKTFGKRDAHEIAEERMLDRMEKSAAEKEAEHHAKLQAELEAEKLGEDFEDSAWVPPSTTKAMDFRARSIFRGGSAPLGSVDVCSASDLSLGTVLHFQFMKSMVKMTFAMFWFSLPSLIFAYAGSRISSVDQDSIGLYRFTLGNMGYNAASASYKTDSTCKSLPKEYNGTCIHLQGFAEITLANAGSILTATEFLQCFIFFCTLWHLKRKTHSCSTWHAHTDP